MKQTAKNKWIKTIPLICALSTTLFTGPVSSFADTNISGKLLRNGEVIQLSNQENTSSYYPQADKDPMKEPVEFYTGRIKKSPIMDTDAIQIKIAGQTLILKGGILYAGSLNQLSPTGSVYTDFGFNTKDVLSGTEFQQEIRWKRIYNRLQPKSVPHTWSVSETHGVSDANTREFAYSVGVELGGELTSATLGKVAGKITGSISQKFSTTTTITDQTTKTMTDTFPAKGTSYPHNDYRVAVYQKEEIYTIIPGENLKKAIQKLEQAASQNHGTAIKATIASFTYTTDELRPIVTPD